MALSPGARTVTQVKLLSPLPAGVAVNVAVATATFALTGWSAGRWLFGPTQWVLYAVGFALVYASAAVSAALHPDPADPADPADGSAAPAEPDSKRALVAFRVLAWAGWLLLIAACLTGAFTSLPVLA